MVATAATHRDPPAADPSSGTTTATRMDPPIADPGQYNITFFIPLSKNKASVCHTNVGKVMYLPLQVGPAPQVDNPFFL